MIQQPLIHFHEFLIIGGVYPLEPAHMILLILVSFLHGFLHFYIFVEPLKDPSLPSQQSQTIVLFCFVVELLLCL